MIATHGDQPTCPGPTCPAPMRRSPARYVRMSPTPCKPLAFLRSLGNIFVSRLGDRTCEEARSLHERRRRTAAPQGLPLMPAPAIQADGRFRTARPRSFCVPASRAEAGDASLSLGNSAGDDRLPAGAPKGLFHNTPLGVDFLRFRLTSAWWIWLRRTSRQTRDGRTRCADI